MSWMIPVSPSGKVLRPWGFTRKETKAYSRKARRLQGKSLIRKALKEGN